MVAYSLRISFEPYSKGYRKEVQGGGRVDLYKSGKMLRFYYSNDVEDKYIVKREGIRENRIG